MVHEHPVELARMEGKSLEAIVGHDEQVGHAPDAKEAIMSGPLVVKEEIEK